jgi:hypothetical protein
LVGATNLNALVVHLMAIKGILALVVALVTFMAKKVFKYEDTMFFVKLVDSTTNAKEVEVWNGHGHTAVPDPEKGERADDGEEVKNPAAAVEV